MKAKKVFALLPILVFLILFLGFGVSTGDFYLMPTVVGFLGALMVAFLQNRKISFEQKLSTVAKGAGDENIVTMCLIFILSGAFSGAVKACGGVESTVNFGLSILPANYSVVGIFIIGCFISLSMGTSVGTIAALTPIAVGVSQKTGFDISLCVGAVVCGAMFGDNLSIISDTTIAAVKTQGCQMKDKFKQNFFIVLPAAIITFIIFLVATFGTKCNINIDNNYSILKIIPYLVVFVTAIIGVNVFIVLTLGILISIILGVLLNNLSLIQLFIKIGEGMSGMYEITIVSIIVAGVVSLVKANGGIDFIIDVIRKNVNGKRGAQFGIALLVSLVDICTANNTVAIVIAGPIAKQISNEFEVDNKTSASVLDIFSSISQSFIPYGAQLLTAASLASITPFDIIPKLYYSGLMLISVIFFIIFRKNKN